MPIHNSRKSAGNFPYRTTVIATVVGECRIKIRKGSKSVRESYDAATVANLPLFVFLPFGLYCIPAFGL